MVWCDTADCDEVFELIEMILNDKRLTLLYSLDLNGYGKTYTKLRMTVEKAGGSVFTYSTT